MLSNTNHISDLFSLNGSHFFTRQIHLYPCGDRDDKDHVTCYLHYLDDNEEEFSARWKAVFLTKSGESLRMPLGKLAYERKREWG
jgi:hypothetical protein